MYRIAIASYDRPQQLISKTFNLLQRHKINFKTIDLFLENDDQHLLYEQAFMNSKFHNKQFNVYLSNTNGIGAKRNFIRDFYSKKCLEDDMFTKNICCIDDDINNIVNWNIPINNLDLFINNAFEETSKRDLNLWGVSGFDNIFYLKRTITTNLKYICGAFCGFIIDLDKECLWTDFDHYEDVDFTCQHFKRDGGVVKKMLIDS